MFKYVHVHVLWCVRLYVYELECARVLINVCVCLCARAFVEHACVCACVRLFNITANVMLIQ